MIAGVGFLIFGGIDCVKNITPNVDPLKIAGLGSGLVAIAAGTAEGDTGNKKRRSDEKKENP